MSVTTGFLIKMHGRKKKPLSAVTYIENLMQSGWVTDVYGKSMYLPLGDDGEYDWQSENLDIDKLMAILKAKERNGEVIGISLTWCDTQSGGEFLFVENGEIMISLTMNRRTIGNTRHTDVNWYLEKLLKVFDQDGEVEGYIFEEF